MDRAQIEKMLHGMTQHDIIVAFGAIFDILDQHDEVTSSELQDMAKSLKENKDFSQKRFDELSKTLSNSMSSLKTDILAQVQKMKPKDGQPGKPGKNADESSIIRKVLAQIPQIPKIQDIVDRVLAIIPPPPAVIRETSDEIRAKLDESLKRFPLPKEVIAGLVDWMKKIEDELDKIKKGKFVGNTVYIGGASGDGGRPVKSYDLSDRLDGSTKSFALPAFYRVISVYSSSMPFVFRPDVDYTVNSSSSIISFDASQIDPAVTLQTGQTLIVIYAEP